MRKPTKRERAIGQRCQARVRAVVAAALGAAECVEDAEELADNLGRDVFVVDVPDEDACFGRVRITVEAL